MMQFVASSSIMLEKQFFRDDEGESFRNVGLQVRIDRGRSPEILSFSDVVKGCTTHDRMSLYCTETLHEPGHPVRAESCRVRRHDKRDTLCGRLKSHFVTEQSAISQCHNVI